jgi:hypothetical protein
MSESLEQRVASQFSGLYMTLVSVMVGLVLADLLSQVHDRMTLWPMSWTTLRTWMQIFAAFSAAMSAWVAYTHLGMLRRRTPTLLDTVDACLVLITLPLDAFAGRQDATGWFIFAAAYCFLGITAVWINTHQSAREPMLRRAPELIRLGGPFTFLYIGGPGYLAMALLTHLHLAPLWLQALAAGGGVAGGAFTVIFFMSEWSRLVRTED